MVPQEVEVRYLLPWHAMALLLLLLREVVEIEESLRNEVFTVLEGQLVKVEDNPRVDGMCQSIAAEEVQADLAPGLRCVVEVHREVGAEDVVDVRGMFPVDEETAETAVAVAAMFAAVAAEVALVALTAAAAQVLIVDADAAIALAVMEARQVQGIASEPDPSLDQRAAIRAVAA